MALGPNLRRMRADRTVDSVAAHVGVVRSAVYLWEADDRRPDPEHLQRLLDLYGASDAERLEAWRLRSLPSDESPAPPVSQSSGEVAHATADHVRAEP